MISTIEITPDSEPAQLRKLLRKKLMTGGAVIRIAADLSASERLSIFERFTAAESADDDADALSDPSISRAPARHSAASLVLKELAALPGLDEQLRERLVALQNPEIDLTLLRRSDLTESCREALSDRRKKIRGSGSSPWAGGASGRTGGEYGG